MDAETAAWFESFAQEFKREGEWKSEQQERKNQRTPVIVQSPGCLIDPDPHLAAK